MSQYSLWFKSGRDISSSLIKQVLTDSRGMVWVSTEDGLNRFDGSKFTIFRQEPGNKSSLAGNGIDRIFEDSRGNLFVSTHEGIQLFDYDTDTFSVPGRRKDEKVIDGNLYNIVELSNGEIWALGRDIMRVSVTSDGEILYDPINLPKELSLVSEVAEDKLGNIWLAKFSEGVYRIDKRGEISHYLGNAGDPVFITFALANDGILYAGCENTGLYRYNPANDSFEVASRALHGIPLKNIQTSPDGIIMVCTDHNGLYEFDPASGEVSLVNIPGMDSDRAKVHSIDYDNYGNMWMGVFQQGVLMIPPSSNEFRHISGIFESRGVCVNSLLAEDDGTIWVGTDNDGIYKFDADKKLLAHHSKNVPPIVTDMIKTKDGKIWVSSFGNGVGTLGSATGIFHPYRIIDSKGNEVKNSFGLAEDNEGNIWVITLGGGLFRIDGSTGRYERKIFSNPNLLWMSSISYSPQRNILMLGTFDGMYLIDLASGKDTYSLSGSVVYAVTPDEGGGYWVATSIGLVHLAADGKVLKTYNRDSGLPSSIIYSVIDKGDNLWIGTSSGLSRMDKKSEKFSNYNVEDGLHSNEFSRDAISEGIGGTLYFGGINGFTYFRPEDINESGTIREVKVTDFYLKGIPVRKGMESGCKEILSAPVFESEEINLSHSDNSFSVEFTSANPKGASQSEYWYAFDDDKWQKSELGAFVGKASLNFTNVAPGKHLLKMKIIDNGVESEVKELVINIRHAWYDTWWAKLIWLLICAVLVVVIIKQLKRNHKRKLMEQETIRQAEINESRIQFLINISHDIRTPMTLIIDPLRRLIASDHDTERQKIHRMMLRNAKRIMRMVNEVMDLRKIEKGKMSLSLRETNAMAFINDIVELFRPSASAKGIGIDFDYEGCTNLSMQVDFEYFDKVMMNLLSNAVKYTPDGGRIKVSLRNEDGMVVIKVADNGAGIPDAEKDRIFERFYQAPNHATGGTGVGLHITRALVELHEGGISVSDNQEEGKGTVFTVTIPLTPSSQSHLPAEPVAGDRSYLEYVELPESEQEDIKEGAVSPKSRKMVYVVEDDGEIRDYLVNELGKYYCVKTFPDGKAALEAIFRKRPDIVVSDVMMPLMDGIELTTAIKQNVELNTLPVILLTAKTRNEDSIEGFDAGADAYIVKPFDIDVLIARIGTLIGNYTRLRNAFNGGQSQERHAIKIETVSNDDKLMERLMKVVNDNLDDYDLTVEKIADKVGLSRVHLYRKLKEITNQSPRDFIRNYRLRRAAELLMEHKLNVSQICDMVGFANPTSFSTAFKKLFGMSPSEYAERNRTTPQDGE